MSPVVEAVGWTLVQFVWQGFAVAGLCWMALRWSSSADVSTRYAIACAAMILMLGAAVWTFSTQLASAGTGSARIPVIGQSDSGKPAEPGELSGASAYVSSDGLAGTVRAAFPYVLAVWGAGVICLSLRLIGGWAYAQSLKYRGIDPPAEAHRRLIERLAFEMGVHQPVWLYISRRIGTPMLIGWLRPVILLPAAALARLDPDQLESILLHELAHVRRHDYLINLCQSAVEVLLFYHPAVWWVSAQIRREREACCDSLVVELRENPVGYTKALLALEELRGSQAPAALGATGGDLLRRVKYLVAPSSAENRPALPGLAVLAAFVIAGFSVIGASAQTFSSAPVERVTVAPSLGPQSGTEGLAASISLRLGQTTLGPLLQEIGEQTGLSFELPANAIGQRLSVDVSEVPASVLLEQLFLRKKLAWETDEARRRISLNWWDGEAADNQLYSFTNETLRVWSELLQRKSSRIDFSVSSMPCRNALAQLADQTGIEFVIDPDVADRPVSAHFVNARVFDVIEALVNPYGFESDYDASGRIHIVPMR